MGANIDGKFAVARFCAKKYGSGWMDGWVVEPGKDCIQQSTKIKQDGKFV